MIEWVKKLLGGRPMQYLRSGFIDIVTKEPVNYYMDMFGRVWMANDRWGWFRVPAPEGTSIARFTH